MWCPQKWLEGYCGFIHADAYPGYDKIFVPDGATEVGCWAHARRKFTEAEGTEPDLAAEILSRIHELFALERFSKAENHDDDARARLRQEKATPILEELRARLVLLDDTVLPKSPFARAIGYTLRLWDALTVYVTDGRLSLENNAAERALRSVALGRKNWMFFMSEGGGKSAAILLSLLKTAEAAGVNPTEWFLDVLLRIDRERDFAKLRPHAWRGGSTSGPRLRLVETT